MQGAIRFRIWRFPMKRWLYVMIAATTLSASPVDAADAIINVDSPMQFNPAGVHTLLQLMQGGWLVERRGAALFAAAAPHYKL
jgi:hypothetical protein